MVFCHRESDATTDAQETMGFVFMVQDFAANRNANSRLTKSTRFGKNEPTLYLTVTVSVYRICDSRQSLLALRSRISTAIGMPLSCKDFAGNRKANSRLTKSARFGEPTLYPAFTVSVYRICDSRDSLSALRSLISAAMGISTVNQVIRPRRDLLPLLRGGKHLYVLWQVNKSRKHTIGSQWQHSVPRALRTETNFQTNSELFNSNHTS
ncbi:hypothetical protein PoB_000611500 [Plakobranchus ocellatus]|uniref:Uncharacterized protein n=1 Tax=Plakobranchus ocellatus TaxID=259542 RepID=A0AAV3Y925_9GAST|nr:hypothetical protein PoB_000611500 [Plakobranchus ocellatus]